MCDIYCMVGRRGDKLLKQRKEKGISNKNRRRKKMAAYNENFGDSSSDHGSVDLEQLILHDVDFAPSEVENVPGIFGKGDRRFDPLLLLEANEDLDQYHYMSEFKMVKEGGAVEEMNVGEPIQAGRTYYLADRFVPNGEGLFVGLDYEERRQQQIETGVLQDPTSRAFARWKCFVKGEDREWVEVDPRTGQMRSPEEDGRVRGREEFGGEKVKLPLGIIYGALDAKLFLKTARDVVAYEGKRGIAVQEVVVRKRSDRKICVHLRYVFDLMLRYANICFSFSLFHFSFSIYRWRGQ